MTKKSPIPKLAEKQLLERAFRIKPLTHDDDGKLRFMEPCDLQTVAFTWDPKPAEEAAGLTPVRAITTIHSYGAPALFKPDIGEVLAQIPADLLDRVTAFTTEPDYARQFTDDSEYHRAVTTLYEGELPASVRAAPVIYKKKPIDPPAPKIEPTSETITVRKPLQFKKGPRL